MAESRTNGRVRDRRRKRAARDKYLDSFTNGVECNDYNDYNDENDEDDENEWTNVELEERGEKSCGLGLPQCHPVPLSRVQKNNTRAPNPSPWLVAKMASSSTSNDNTGKKRSLGTADGVFQPKWDDDDDLVLPAKKESKLLPKKKNLTSDITCIACDGDSLMTNSQRLEDQGYEVIVYTINQFQQSARAGKRFLVKPLCAHDGSSELDEELAIIEDESSGAWTPTERNELIGVVASAIAIAETLTDYQASQAVILASEHGGDAAQMLVSLVNVALGKLHVRGVVDARAKAPVSKWAKSFTSKMKRISLKSMTFAAKEFYRDEI
ncbi:hypothetical protein N9S30_00630 [bacterium]|nr:hypothetical protein [bacterium]